MIVAFCGHSNYVKSQTDEKKVLDYLESKVGDSDCEFFLGEYGGFDSFAYLCALKYKKLHPNCKLVYITPYYGVEHQKNIQSQKSRFDLVIFPPLENVPPRYAILHRNRWIVEKADLLIAYVTCEYGGAYTMYTHAKRRKMNIFNIAEKQ